eukprot:scaffold4387_cov126-Isochrysis_galbana.AAC.10
MGNSGSSPPTTGHLLHHPPAANGIAPTLPAHSRLIEAHPDGFAGVGIAAGAQADPRRRRENARVRISCAQRCRASSSPVMVTVRLAPLDGAPAAAGCTASRVPVADSSSYTMDVRKASEATSGICRTVVLDKVVGCDSSSETAEIAWLATSASWKLAVSPNKWCNSVSSPTPDVSSSHRRRRLLFSCIGLPSCAR